MFVEYEDATFSKRKASKPDHLGILGPVLKGEAGDEFIVSDETEMLFSGNVLMINSGARQTDPLGPVWESFGP